MNLGEEGTTVLAMTGEDAATEEGVLVEESEQGQVPNPLQQPDQQGDGIEDTEEGEDIEQEELPLPLFGN